jgi:glycosyltransferase involved in cell wall biosynthesis
MKQPLVSIIMPVYNSEKYISDAINSILKQTYNNWELIIIDDCSTDKSRELINEFSEKDYRIHEYYFSKNMGVSKARNYAIENSNGKYIAFLDSDDFWAKNKLKLQINFMLENNYAFTYTSYTLVDQNEKQIKDIFVAKEVNYFQLLKGNIITCSTVVLNKEIVGDISMPKIKHEDYATWLNILKQGIKAHGVQESLTYYRKQDDSITANKFQSSLWTWNIYRKHQNLSLLKSIYYFINYSIRGFIKHYYPE